jgi:uncharacterized protein (DUF433 family)
MSLPFHQVGADGLLNPTANGGMLRNMEQPVPIESDPELLGGVAVFAGTRVPVDSLFDHLEAGDSLTDFLEGFPSVRREQAVAVLEWARAQVLRPAA